MHNWIESYFKTLHDLQMNALVTNENEKSLFLAEGFKRYIQLVKTARQMGGKLIFVGNGGSAGIASHVAIDYSKNGNIPSMAFSDASALTCISNDFGYEYVFAKQIEFYGRPGDLLIAISSSGRSANIIKAVVAARMLGCPVVTLSGFDADNPLRQLGDLNFYIPSKSYGFVEVAHLSLVHAILDNIIETQCVVEKNRYGVLENEKSI